MIKGHDTTGIAFTWALFCLGNNPEVQKKVHEELNEVFGDSDEPPSKQQLTQLKYIDRVIKEVLRLYPSAPIINRILDHDVKIGNNISNNKIKSKKILIFITFKQIITIYPRGQE